MRTHFGWVVFLSVLVGFCTQLAGASHAHKAVWKVQNASSDMGTGFFIGKNLFVTNFHVAFSSWDSGDQIFITQEHQHKISLNHSQIKAFSILHDLVLFETKQSVNYFLKTHPSSLEEDEDLFLLSYPLGNFQEITKTGRIQFHGGIHTFAVDHSLLAGASGSPVLNFTEEVVGIAFAADGNMLSMIPVTYLHRLLSGKTGLDCSTQSLKECVKQEQDHLKQAAQAGDTSAQYVLALLYDSSFEAQGRTTHYTLPPPSYTWMKKAAKGGYHLAQNDLGLMYYNGKKRGRVKRNIAKAFDLLNQAAHQGLASAQLNLGIAFHQNKTSPYFDPRRAFLLIEQAARQGYSLAQFHLALMYYRGVGTPHNMKQTFHYMEKSAQAGFAPAQNNLGLMYKDGNGTGRNLQKALMWIRRAAHQGWVPAKHNLHLIKKIPALPTSAPNKAR